MSSTALQYWLDKFEIPRRDMNHPIYQAKRAKLAHENRKYRGITKEFLEQEYLTGRKTLNQIASEYGCSWDTVRKQVLRHGFPMRWDSRKGRAKNKRSSADYRRFQKKVLSHFGYRCVICGYDRFVNCHHIIPYSKSEDNSLQNGICLCPNHHSEADYGLISIEELKSYVKKYNKTQSELRSNVQK